MILDSTSDLSVAGTALLHELGSIGIVQVEKDHHGGMLRPTQFIKLEMIGLAIVQELLPRIQNLAFLKWIFVYR